MSGRGLNVFGHHANFGLYLFAPFYWVGWGSPALLDSAMVVSLGTAAVPVYLIARDRTESVAIGLVVAVAYLLHFSVRPRSTRASSRVDGGAPALCCVFCGPGPVKRFAVAVVYAVCWKTLRSSLRCWGCFREGSRSASLPLRPEVRTLLRPSCFSRRRASGATFYAGDYGVLGDSGLEVAVNATLFERDETFRLWRTTGPVTTSSTSASPMDGCRTCRRSGCCWPFPSSLRTCSTSTVSPPTHSPTMSRSGRGPDLGSRRPLRIENTP